MKYNAFNLLVVALLCNFAVSDASANRLLIDDFSVDQQGFVAGDPTVFDLLEDAQLFGGGREIWGSAEFPLGTFGANVEAGSLNANTASNDAGGVVVTWPARITDSEIDLSEYSYLTLDVGEVEKEVVLRFTVFSNTTGQDFINSAISFAGRHTFQLPSSADLSSVKHISAGFGLDENENISLNAVWLSVPEPSSLPILIGALSALAWCRAGVRSSHRSQFSA